MHVPEEPEGDAEDASRQLDTQELQPRQRQEVTFPSSLQPEPTHTGSSCHPGNDFSSLVCFDPPLSTSPPLSRHLLFQGLVAYFDTTFRRWFQFIFYTRLEG